jgi:hypothetical protein
LFHEQAISLEMIADDKLLVDMREHHERMRQ